jgi:hypothetical protein
MNVKSRCIDRVAGKVVVRIMEESFVRDHDRWQACIPKRGVIAQACFGQDPGLSKPPIGTLCYV